MSYVKVLDHYDPQKIKLSCIQEECLMDIADVRLVHHRGNLATVRVLKRLGLIVADHGYRLTHNGETKLRNIKERRRGGAHIQCPHCKENCESKP